MSEMVDKAASAVVSIILADLMGCGELDPEDGFINIPECNRGIDVKAVVIAILKAMREPTENMVRAGMDATDWPICNGEVAHRWEAMIDAAMDSLRK